MASCRILLALSFVSALLSHPALAQVRHMSCLAFEVLGRVADGAPNGSHSRKC